MPGNSCTQEKFNQLSEPFVGEVVLTMLTFTMSIMVAGLWPFMESGSAKQLLQTSGFPVTNYTEEECLAIIKQAGALIKPCLEAPAGLALMAIFSLMPMIAGKKHDNADEREEVQKLMSAGLVIAAVASLILVALIYLLAYLQTLGSQHSNTTDALAEDILYQTVLWYLPAASYLPFRALVEQPLLAKRQQLFQVIFGGSAIAAAFTVGKYVLKPMLGIKGVGLMLDLEGALTGFSYWFGLRCLSEVEPFKLFCGCCRFSWVTIKAIAKDSAPWYLARRA